MTIGDPKEGGDEAPEEPQEGAPEDDRPASTGLARAIGRSVSEQHLRTVCFYDVRSLALEQLDFGYAELCNLLGGGDVACAVTSSAVPGRKQVLQAAAAALSAPGQWLFEGDPVRFPLEVLRQKLSAFLDVVAGLEAVHGKLGRPHFAVAPANVMASCARSGNGAPVRWGFRVALIDLGSPVRIAAAEPGRRDIGELLGPGPELREDLPLLPYVSPDLHGLDGQSLAMPVTCRVAAQDDGSSELTIEAKGTTNLKQYCAGDLVAVAAGAAADAVLWARLREIRPRGFIAVARLPADHACLSWHGRHFEARLSFHRHFGPPVDLFGLGMLLFRTLLVNDEQTMEEVADAVGKCQRRLGDELTGAVDEHHASMRLQQLMRGKELQDRFEPHHLSDHVMHSAAASAFLAPVRAVTPSPAYVSPVCSAAPFTIPACRGGFRHTPAWE